MVNEQFAGQWSASHGVVNTVVSTQELTAGQHVDFITDCMGDVGFDSFEWQVSIKPGEGALVRSAQSFPQPVIEPLDAWGLFVQALLASNELMFVD